MAKVKGATRVPKVKNKNASVHSRAARRAASPTEKIDLPQHNTEAVVEETYVPGKKLSSSTTTKLHDSHDVLAAHSNGAIAKKKKQKPLSRQQRLRREKGLERAEIVMDQKETAIEKSKSRGRKVQGRRAAWDELNEATKADGTKKVNKAAKSKNKLNPEQEEDGMAIDIDDAEDEDIPDPAAALVGPDYVTGTSTLDEEIS